MQFPRLWRTSKGEASSDVISDSTPSSPAAKTGAFTHQDGIHYYPNPSFAERYDAAESIGRIFSAVESVVKAVNKRDFYFTNINEETEGDTKIELMEAWEAENDGSKFIEDLVRTWLKAGTAIIGPDWKFVPMKQVKYMKTDLYNRPQEVILDVRGKEWTLGAITENGHVFQKYKLEDYIITHYIHDTRDPWGMNLYHSICTTFTDLDGKESTALYKGFRQIEQDGIKLHHKMSSPRSLWIFPKLRNKEDLNSKNPKSLAYRIAHMLHGDRIIGGSEFEGAEIKQEQIDGKTRFPEITDLIKGEVEVAAQSSTSRMIERPSAMADARVGAEQDDDTTLYVCELVRRLFDYVIIPRVIGDKSVEFRWGSSDDFEFNFEQSLAALREGAISKEEFREQWKSSGARLDDALFTKMQDDKKANTPPAFMQLQQPPQEPEDGDDIQELRRQAYKKIINSV